MRKQSNETMMEEILNFKARLEQILYISWQKKHEETNLEESRKLGSNEFSKYGLFHNSQYYRL